MSIRFGIRSALAVFAVFAACLAFMRSLGPPGIALAVISASAISGVIILARREHVVGTVHVVIGAAWGAWFGLMFLSPFILSSSYGYDHGYGETAKSEIIGTVLGVLCGVVVMSWCNRLESRLK